MSDSLWPHGLQHARLPCLSLSPRVCSNSWKHPTISSSVVPFPSCLQYFPASMCFPMGWLFTSGGQNIGASASISVLPVNIQLISFRSDWFDLLAVQGALMCLLQHHRSKASVLQCSAFFMVQLWHLYVTTRKTVTLSIGTFVNKVMSLLPDTLSRFGIVLFPGASVFKFHECSLSPWWF